MMRCTIRVLLAASVALTLGCGTSNGTTQCNVGADCASGACSVSGQCIPASVGDGGELDGGGSGSDGGGTPDALADAPSTTTDADASTTCVPNNDGTITRAEVPMQAGLRATYLVAANATWDTTGTTGDAATMRTWDLTGPLAGDHSVIFEAQSPTGTWWATSFTAATFAMQLEASQSLLGVFQVSDEALSLIGVVSPTSTAPSTQVTYATPIPTLKFPLSVGATWTTTSAVTGTVSGVPSSYSEQYVSKVDSAGELKTPFGNLAVMRVGTVLTQTVGIVATVTRSFIWVAECVGPVAQATSQSNASTAEFSSDVEVRRLSP